MKSIKIAGLCLTAMFVMSIVTAASASAEETKPYMLQCRNVGAKQGHWKDEQCEKEPGTGSWDTRAAGSQGDETFSSTSGESLLITETSKLITCTSDRDEGKLTGPKEVGKVFVTFFGCEFETLRCKSPGAAAGEIRTKELKGKLGYLNVGKTKVGLVLEPVVGALTAEFTCGTGSVEVKSAVIGEIGPLNRNVKSLELHYNLVKGIQEWQSFEEGPVKRFLETRFGFGMQEMSGLETQDQIKFQFDTRIVA